MCGRDVYHGSEALLAGGVPYLHDDLPAVQRSKATHTTQPQTSSEWTDIDRRWDEWLCVRCVADIVFFMKAAPMVAVECGGALPLTNWLSILVLPTPEWPSITTFVSSVRGAVTDIAAESECGGELRR